MTLLEQGGQTATVDEYTVISGHHLSFVQGRHSRPDRSSRACPAAPGSVGVEHERSQRGSLLRRSEVQILATAQDPYVAEDVHPHDGSTGSGPRSATLYASGVRGTRPQQARPSARCADRGWWRRRDRRAHHR